MRKKIILVAGMSCVLVVGCSSIKNAPRKINSAGHVTESVVISQSQKDAKIVVPLPAVFTDKASDTMPDGKYSVSFGAKDLNKKDNGFTLTMEFYNYDRYSIGDVDSLVAGDVIQVRGKEVYIESIAWNKDKKDKVFGVDINGGTQEDGISLRLEEDCYRTTSLDDYPLYYSIGIGTLKLSENLKVQDCYDFETLPDGVVTEYKDLPENITKQRPECWSEANTVITVKSGQIAYIVRNWTP